MSLFKALLGKRTAADIGRSAPKSFKFGVVVTIAIFWTDFLRTVFSQVSVYITDSKSPMVISFIIATIATILGLVVLDSHRRIKKKLEKIEL